MTSEEGILKVATYCRVSTSKDDQINSFERQMQMYEEEILCHDNWQLFKSYYDKGISGTDVLNRAGFLEMKEAGLKHEYDILITREVSRLSRNIQQFYEFVRSLVKKGVRIYFIDDEIDTAMPDFEIRAAGIISHAQDESRKTSQRVRRGQKIAMKNGVVHGTSLLGYDLINGRLSVNRRGAEIVKSIFDMYVNKEIGIRQIKRHLEGEGIKTFKGKSIWNTKTILSILKNEKYCGDLIQGKTYTPDYLTHEKKKNPGEKTEIKNHHEPIVSRDMWNKAQAILAKKSPSKKSGGSSKYVFSGKIQCGECKKSFVSGSRKNRDGSITKIWRCSRASIQGTKSSDDHGCNNSKQLRNDAAMNMLLNAVETLVLDSDYIKQNLTAVIKKTLRPSVDRNTANLEFYYSELEKAKTRQKKILENELSGSYLPEIINDKLNETNCDIKIIENNIKVLEKNAEASMCYTEFERQITEYIDSILLLKTLPDSYLRALLNKITIFYDRRAVLELKHIDRKWFFKLQ